jgi:hypothetical protein
MDRELNLLFRKLRNKLGYGQGWTFREALWEFLHPKLVAIGLILLSFYLASHLRFYVYWVN